MQEGEVRENPLTLSYAEVGAVRGKCVCMLVCVGEGGGSKYQSDAGGRRGQ